MIPLRDYQELRAAGAVTELRAGRSCAIVLPTGTGKTRTALAVCERMLQGPTRAGRVLWLVDRKVLIKQTMKAAVGFSVPLEVKTIQALAYKTRQKCRRCHGEGCDTCGGSGKHRVAPIVPGDYDAVIVDEGHKFLTPGRMQILHDSETPFLLLTATPRRGDGKHIEDLVGKNYVGGPYTIGQAIADGWLCDCQVKRVEIRELDLRGVKRTRGGVGDFNEAELAEAMNIPSINEEMVMRWLENGRRPDGDLMITNFFAVDTAHADALADEVNRQCGAGTCVPIHSNLPGSLADERVDGFLAGKWRVVTSVMMIAEGFDYPAIECGVLARPTKSERLLVQMLGRFLRPHASKPHATLLDCAGAYESLDLERIYDAVEPKAPNAPAVSRGDGEAPDEIDAIPMMSDVISRVRMIDLFRRECAAARGLPWVHVRDALPGGGPAYVLVVSKAELLVVAQSKHEPSMAAAARLHYGRGLALCSMLAAARPEPELFAAIEHKCAGMGTDDVTEAQAKKKLRQWYKDRGAPSDELSMKLAELGRDVPRTHYEAVRMLRRMYAAGEVAR